MQLTLRPIPTLTVARHARGHNTRPKVAEGCSVEMFWLGNYSLVPELQRPAEACPVRAASIARLPLGSPSHLDGRRSPLLCLHTSYLYISNQPPGPQQQVVAQFLVEDTCCGQARHSVPPNPKRCFRLVGGLDP